jgi:uncharacterized membrane protein
MNRHQLDALLAAHTLTAPGIERALQLTENRPSSTDWRTFGVKSLGLAGMAALGAGLIFFIAANWQSMGVMGRFAIVQVAVLLGVGIAWWKAPSHINGVSNVMPAALIFATLASGTVLALFGQTYQTGADVYELFSFWALLTLPFALAGMSGALWGVWVCILNVALALFSGWHGPGDFVWAMFDRWGVDKPAAMMLPFAVNLAGAALAYGASQTRYAKAAPLWLVRLLLTFAFTYGTSACLYAVSQDYGWRSAQNSVEHGITHFSVFIVFVMVSAVVAVITLRQKRDVYPLALIAASGIIISTAFLIKRLLSFELGGIFLLAIWLIAVSTATAFLLMRFVRVWRPAANTQAGE